MLQPKNPLIMVFDDSIKEIRPESLNIELIGRKAYGLCCLPKDWTLPFFVISEILISKYAELPEKNRSKLLSQCIDKIFMAAKLIDLKKQDLIIVRSSGISEGIVERGKYVSEEGFLEKVHQPLSQCIKSVLSDCKDHPIGIPLIIQKMAAPVSKKGHLSNERRCYEENRDWLGEFEDAGSKENRKAFKVNLRNWRERISVSTRIQKPLECLLSVQIPAVLRIPAAWAYQQGHRLHYEWVWDSRTIYIVQADEENETTGVDPYKVLGRFEFMKPIFSPKCLKRIDDPTAKKYNKIKNVQIYQKLGLPTTSLYILDDQSIIQDLIQGKTVASLEADLNELTKSPLIIRTDILSSPQNKFQLLPRTDEIRSAKTALNWIVNKSIELKKETSPKKPIAFIFHNFVPALSSAFAFAAPNTRKVQIEALWGLPEGLYYNAHDKYVVDTMAIKRKELREDKIDKYSILERRFFKRFFFAPTETGQWRVQLLKKPFDWRGSIPKKQWIKEMAYASRRIAEEEGRPLSIMWFVGVPPTLCKQRILPWYHEFYDLRLSSRALIYRTKTPFDTSLVIRNKSDIKTFKEEAEKPKSSLRRVRIQLTDVDLIRDRDTLRKIGEYAYKIGATILLEGGILSHAYYQLMQTKASLEVLHPFDESEDKREFYKLVRDKIPDNIREGGEIVSIARLSGEFLLRALREKIVEESFETLDAADQDYIIEELADLSETISAILRTLRVRPQAVRLKQAQKRNKSGSFKKGLVLLKTENPLPPETSLYAAPKLFNDAEKNKQKTLPLEARQIMELGHLITRWSDKREHPASSEMIIHLVVPLIRDTWTVNSPEIVLESGNNNILRAKLTGTRAGSKMEIELSIYLQNIKEKQLTLF